MNPRTVTAFGLTVLLLGTLTTPFAAFADGSQQKNKNTWRNLAIGSGAIGVIGLLNHNGTEAVLGAAGAAYSANRYEQDRKHQSERRTARESYRYNGGSYVENGKKYYKYAGRMYYQDLNTGERHIVG